MVDPEFLKKHNLSLSSKLHKYVDIFLPLHTNQKGKAFVPNRRNKNVPDFQGDFKTLAIWTNIKAKLVGARLGGSYYPDLKDSTVLEIHQHMFIYILNGLSPSPSCPEMKFNTQAVNQINGSLMILLLLHYHRIILVQDGVMLLQHL